MKRSRSNEQLRLDTRLAKRRGWLEPGELEQVLKALPDAAEHGEWIEMPSLSSDASEASEAAEAEAEGATEATEETEPR